MGALPNDSPRPARETKKKKTTFQQVDPAELTVEPRTLGEIDSEFRGSGQLWTPFLAEFDSCRAHLASGLTFMLLTSYIVHSANRGRDWKKTARSWEVELDIAEAALWCRCNYKSINRELLYMQQRDMAIVARLAGGRAVVRIVFEAESLGDKIFPGWSNIVDDYKTWAAAQRQTLDEQAEEAEAEAENPADRDATYVKIKPQAVKRGKGSKSKIDAFVKSMRVECDEKSPVDINISGEVVSGELVLSVCGNETQNARSKQDAKPVVSTRSQETPGHIRPNGQKLPPNEGSQNYPHTRVNRGAELAKLFDPLLLNSCKRTLSANIFDLQAASKAIGDTPHDFLEQAVTRRGQTPIKNPSHCAAICREIRANYLAERELTAAGVIQKLPTRAEIEAMMDAERAARKGGKR